MQCNKKANFTRSASWATTALLSGGIGALTAYAKALTAAHLSLHRMSSTAIRTRCVKQMLPLNSLSAERTHPESQKRGGESNDHIQTIVALWSQNASLAQTRQYGEETQSMPCSYTGLKQHK